MQAVVDQSDLIQALQAVARAVAGRTTLPVLSGVHLSAAGETLTVTGTDLELAVQARVPARVEAEGQGVLPARYLNELVRRIPFGAIRIEVDPASWTARLQWERSEYVLHGFPPAEYPAPTFDGQDGAPVPAAALRKALRQTVFAVSSDEAKPALTGVWLARDGDSLLAVGCDGYRVAMARTPAGPDGIELDVVIPGRAVAEMGRLMADAGEIRLAVREQRLWANLGGVQLATRLVDAPYPNVPQLLPRDYPHRVSLERAALLEAAERIAPLADARQTARWLVILEPQPGRLVLHTHDPDIGQAREEVPARYEGPELRIGINVRYLVDGLRHLEGDTLEMGLIGPDGPVRLEAAEDPGCQHVIYPIRI